MLLYIMLYIVLAYLMLFAALTNAVMSLYYVNFVFCLIGEYRIQTYLSSDYFPQ